MNLNRWVSDHFGFDGWWTCLQFDHAVMWFGNHVDGLLLEREETFDAHRGLITNRKYESVEDALNSLTGSPKSDAMAFIALAKKMGNYEKR